MTAEIKPIRGKVARVLNNRNVALNKGWKDGVEAGMVFNILSPSGADIADPDTGERLGSVELTKAAVKVTDVQERLSVASTFRFSRVNVGGAAHSLSLTSGALAKMFQPPKWETRYETLEVDENAENELSERDSRVKTGDPVIQIVESETNIDMQEPARLIAAP